MSLDDGFGRDPRLDHLAQLCGWTRRETAGCLQLDVWPLCYDRVTPNIPTRDLNIAAARYAVSPVAHPGGFAGALIEAELARPSTRADVSFMWVRKGHPDVLLYWRDREWRDRVYLRGSAERIAYLVKAEEAGRVGGRNSGKSRANTGGLPSREPQGTLKGSGNVLNPPDTPTVPDSASAPDLASVPALPEQRASPPPAVTKPAGAPKLKPVPSPEAISAAERLLKLVVANNPGSTLAKAAASKQRETAIRWADALRLLHGADKHSWEEIVATIDWCQSDGFWKSNILSGDKLREKWDMLTAQRSRSSPVRDVRYGRVEPHPPEAYDEDEDPFGERGPATGVLS